MVDVLKGDLISLAREGRFDVIVHGCNCMCTMGAGIAVGMKKAFGCHKFPKEHFELRGDINKLGTIDFKAIKREDLANNHSGGFFNKVPAFDKEYLYVVNAYTQYNYGRNHDDGDEKPFNYTAFNICLQKINHIFEGKHIGLPMIGAGLAGGNWKIIEDLIIYKLDKCKVTIVEYEKNSI